MQKRKIFYVLCCLYEVCRLFLILTTQNLRIEFSFFWFSIIPYLIISPCLFFMLIINEEQFKTWLSLLFFIKALSVCSLLLFFVVFFAMSFSVSFDASSISLLGTLISIVAIDTGIGIYCERRSKTICK